MHSTKNTPCSIGTYKFDKEDMAYVTRYMLEKSRREFTTFTLLLSHDFSKSTIYTFKDDHYFAFKKILSIFVKIISTIDTILFLFLSIFITGRIGVYFSNLIFILCNTYCFLLF